MDNIVKNCLNCVHAYGSKDVEFKKCARAGIYCEIVRQFSGNTMAKFCDPNFSGWQPLPELPPPPPSKGIWGWLKSLWLGDQS